MASISVERNQCILRSSKRLKERRFPIERIGSIIFVARSIEVKSASGCMFVPGGLCLLASESLDLPDQVPMVDEARV